MKPHFYFQPVSSDAAPTLTSIYAHTFIHLQPNAEVNFGSSPPLSDLDFPLHNFVSFFSFFCEDKDYLKKKKKQKAMC